METEQRLIDANAYPCQTCEVSHCYQNCNKFTKWFESTVDAVEVVRCKDCRYWQYVEYGYGECTHKRFHLDGHPDPTMEINGFCSCGERRSDK